MAQPIRTAFGTPRSAWRCLLVSPHNGCRRHRRCEIIRTSFASPPSGPPPQPSSEQVKFLFLLRALARLSLQIVGTHGSCVRVNSWKSGSTFGRTGRASLHSGGSVSELQLAAPVRMAGALRKAGEAAAKLRRPGAAVSERSEFCRSAAARPPSPPGFSPRLWAFWFFSAREKNARPAMEACSGSMLRSGASCFQTIRMASIHAP